MIECFTIDPPNKITSGMISYKVGLDQILFLASPLLYNLDQELINNLTLDSPASS